MVCDKNYIFDFNLRNIIEKKFGFKTRLTSKNIDYLMALVDAGYPDAQELIDGILKYEVIEIGQAS
jgi:hypothetical protein